MKDILRLFAGDLEVAMTAGRIAAMIDATSSGAPARQKAVKPATRLLFNRVGDPDQTAAVALLLTSDDSSFMTGSEVFVGGGLAQVRFSSRGRQSVGRQFCQLYVTTLALFTIVSTLCLCGIFYPCTGYLAGD
jgi:hypothetical protein